MTQSVQGFAARAMLAVALMLPLALPGHAQGYPDKPVKIVVPFGPGGPLDLVGRPVANDLEARLHQPFVLDYRAGANGIIGSSAVAKATPDGATFLIVSTGFSINPSTYKSLPFDTVADFKPVGLLAKGAIVLIANPKLGVSNVRELVELAKSRPASNRLKFGSSGFGGSLHLAGELLKTRAGINMIHVPYNGANAAMIDTVGDHIDISFVSVAPAVELIKTGQLKALGIAGATRLPTLPDVPTLAEQGFPGFDVSSFYGLVAPARTPDSVIKTISETLKQSLASDEVKNRMAAVNLEASWMSPDDFGKYLQNQIANWSLAAKAAGVEPK